MNVRERFHPVPMAANASYTIRGWQLGGFVAKTSGTITVTTSDGTIIVDAIPVTLGVYLPLPFIFEVAGAVVQLAGGASGTLAV